MALYFLDGAKQSFSSIDTVYDWELPILSDGESLISLVLPELLPPHILEQFEVFSAALGVVPDNLGKLVYNQNCELVYFAFPSIGMYEGKPHLKIGDKAECEGRSFSAVYVPLEKDGTNYSLMGTKLEFYTIQDQNDRTKTIRAYLKLKKNNGESIDTFLIPIRVDRDVDYDKLEASFESGKLEDHLNGFSQIYASATKLFLPAFKENVFPDEGVLVIFGSGRFNSVEWNGQMIESVSFQVLAASHPDLDVQVGKKDDVKIVELHEVGSISFSKSTLPFSQWQAGVIDNTSIFPVHFWEVAKDNDGNERHDWTPKLICSKQVQRLPQKSRDMAIALAKTAGISLPTGKTSAALPAKSTVNGANSSKQSKVPELVSTGAKGVVRSVGDDSQTVTVAATAVKPKDAKNSDKNPSDIPF